MNWIIAGPGIAGIFIVLGVAWRDLDHQEAYRDVELANVPLDLLLPRAAAFIHHGGIGSTSQGLAAGISQVLMPLAHDQFDNAARVEKLNVGKSIPAPKFSAARLTTALQRLLASQSVAAACRTAADQLTNHDGLTRAAETIDLKFATDAQEYPRR
jgi:UDP:flavonoid glycosyltransferase YjiC (YdhE family)